MSLRGGTFRVAVLDRVRRQMACLAALVLLVAAAPSAEAQVERRVALVIGNAKYQHVTPLVNPENDAHLIATTLRNLGFRLVGGDVVLNLDKAGMDGVVQEFGRESQGADIALFYYAGHGVQVRESNYLCR